jgi:hypothetical protein
MQSGTVHEKLGGRVHAVTVVTRWSECAAAGSLLAKTRNMEHMWREERQGASAAARLAAAGLAPGL